MFCSFNTVRLLGVLPYLNSWGERAVLFSIYLSYIIAFNLSSKVEKPQSQKYRRHWCMLNRHTQRHPPQQQQQQFSSSRINYSRSSNPYSSRSSHDNARRSYSSTTLTAGAKRNQEPATSVAVARAKLTWGSSQHVLACGYSRQ